MKAARRAAALETMSGFGQPPAAGNQAITIGGGASVSPISPDRNSAAAICPAGVPGVAAGSSIDVVTSVPMDVCTIAAGSVPIDATGTIGVVFSMPDATDEAATPSDSLWKVHHGGLEGVAMAEELEDYGTLHPDSPFRHLFQQEAIAHTVLFKWKYLVWRNKRRAHIALPSEVYVAFRSKFDIPGPTASHIAALSVRGVRPTPFICTRAQYHRWGYREGGETPLTELQQRRLRTAEISGALPTQNLPTNLARRQYHQGIWIA
jgi:hypothetical protein